MGSSKKTTVGYRYYMGLHFGICHGPVDMLQQVVVGERSAWSGSQTTGGAIGIDAQELFGGDKREGGVYGILDVMMGEATQGQNSYLSGLLGAGIPAFRGILSAVFNGGLIASNNPYVKPWAFRVRRIVQGWTGGAAWYPEKASIPGQICGNSAIAFCIDFSQSMLQEVSPGVTRESVLRSAIVTALNSLKASTGSGATIHIALIPFSYRVYDAASPTSTGIPATNYVIQYNNATAANIDAIISAVNSIPLVYGTAWDGPLISAQSFFSQVPSGTEIKSLIFVTDGEPWQRSTDTPTVDYTDAYASTVTQGVTYAAQDATDFAVDEAQLLQNSGVGIYTFNIGTGGNEFTSQIDNTANDGAPVLDSPTASDISNALMSSLPLVQADMNPAHIVYQCLTDTAWGMGYPTSAIDSASFTAAANALYDEGFGLSILWNRQEAIDAFIQVVLDHIGGMLYVKPDAGTFALKLIRDDYDRGTLPQYGPTNLISADDYQRQAWGETINEITVVYTSPCSGKDASVTVQDAANIMAQSGVVAQTRAYPGIHLAPLAQRVAMRDLIAASTPLARIRITATRAAWAVFPGDVFRLTWPEYDIADVVYRALAVNRGTLQDGQIIIDAVEDVFALPDNTYLVEQPGEWEDPSADPAPAPYREMIETPYWDLVRNLSAADMDYVDALAGYLETLAVRPSGAAINYTIYTKVGVADYAEAGNGDFCPSATLVGALTKTTTAITLTNGVDLDIVAAGGYAVIEGEYVLLSAINWLAGTATISRGVLDTVPDEHTAGTRIWFADAYQGFATTEYADGETVDVKLLPVTGRGELDVDLAPSDSLTFDQRQYRPYAPGKVLVNAAIYPAFIDGDEALALSWAHRDRLLQTAYLVEQSESSIGPEAGTTYTVRVYGETNSLIHTYSSLSGTSQTYLTTDEILDSAIPGDTPVFDPRGSVLEASDAAADDSFGSSVALSADGAVMAVGALAWEGGASGQGGVYIYDWSGSAWVQRGSVLTASDAAADDGFGASVALSSDGAILVVGAWAWEGTYSGQGGVYIYDWSGSAWVQRGSVLTASDAAATYWFGSGVALSAAGDVLAVGSYANESVYIYDWSGSAWVQRGSNLTASDGVAGDGFGISVSFDSAGEAIAVGAHIRGTIGAVYTYDWSGSAWVQRGSVLTASDSAAIDRFARGVALSSDGSLLLVGSRLWEGTASNQGGVYVYDQSGSAWVQRGSVLTASDAAADDSFGASVALSSDGLVMAVGADSWEGAASNQGGVYVYDTVTEYRLNGLLRFELESVRGGLTSYQKHDHEVRRTGYGFNYGMYYG